MLQQISTAALARTTARAAVKDTTSLEALNIAYAAAIKAARDVDTAHSHAVLDVEATLPAPGALIDGTNTANLECGITAHDIRNTPKHAYICGGAIRQALAKLTEAEWARKIVQPDGTIAIELRTAPAEPFYSPDMSDPRIVRMQERLRQAIEYERIRAQAFKAAGVSNSLHGLNTDQAAERAVARIEKQIERNRATTQTDLVAKARAAKLQMKRCGGEISDDFAIAASLVADVLRLGAH